MKGSERNGLDQVSLPVHVSKANVLDDLGFSTLESAALKVKAELLDGILEEIHRKKYGQKDLANLLEEYQPQVSHLLRGKVSKFSIEKLLRYAESLGLKPTLTLRPVAPVRIPHATKRARRRIA